MCWLAGNRCRYRAAGNSTNLTAFRCLKTFASNRENNDFLTCFYRIDTITRFLVSKTKRVDEIRIGSHLPGLQDDFMSVNPFFVAIEQKDDIGHVMIFR